MFTRFTTAALGVLLLAAPAFAQGLASTVKVQNGEVWLTPAAQQSGPLFRAASPETPSWRVTNEPFKSILTQLDGKTVNVTLAADGKDASVTKLQATWAPPPFNSVTTWITGGDASKLTVDPNPYNSRVAYANELTIAGATLAGPATPRSDDALPLPAATPPKKGAVDLSKATVDADGGIAVLDSIVLHAT